MSSAKPSSNAIGQDGQEEPGLQQGSVTRTRESRACRNALQRRPDGVATVLTALLKLREDGVKLRNKEHLKVLISGVSRKYGDPGSTDDLIRYLYSRGFVVRDDDGKPQMNRRTAKRTRRFLKRIGDQVP